MSKPHIKTYNVLMVTNNYAPKIGGVEYSVHGLSQHLGCINHDITVLTAAYRSHQKKEKVGTYAVERIHFFQLLISLFGIQGRVKHLFDTADLIHAHSLFSPMAMLGMLLAKKMGKPCVLTSHSIYKGWHCLPAKWVSRLVKHVIGVSHGVVQNSLSYNPRLKTYVIPNGIHLSPSAPSAPSFAANPAKAPFTIGTTARLVSRKNVSAFVKLAALLSLKYTHLQFVIIGGGPKFKALNSLVKKYGLEAQFTFTGALSHEKTLDKMKTLDLFISTAPHEAFGMVVLEALFLHVPCIAFDNNGTRDILTHGETGFLVSSIEEMAKAASRFVENSLLRQKMISQFMVRKAGQFDWLEISKRTVEVYRAAMLDLTN